MTLKFLNFFIEFGELICDTFDLLRIRFIIFLKFNKTFFTECFIIITIIIFHWGFLNLR